MPANSKKYMKDNYKKYWWKKSEMTYRAKLNQANRELGNYWNWDWKDLTHSDWNKKNFSKKNLKTGSMKANRKKGAAKATANKKKTKTKTKKGPDLYYV